MYKPAHFNPKEQSQIVELITSYPFVTMISKDEAGSLETRQDDMSREIKKMMKETL